LDKSINEPYKKPSLSAYVCDLGGQVSIRSDEGFVCFKIKKREL
jgi:hypothetical protein